MKPTLSAFSLISFFVFSCSPPRPVYELRIKGSESMHETFSALKADFEKLQDTLSVTIDGGGSRTGLMAIRDREAQIGLSSYPFDLDSMLGVEHGVKELVVAYDGIVLISNENNPVSELSDEHVQGIFTGTIHDWSLVGGIAGPIVPVIRDENSGTQQFFADYFKVKEPTSGAIVAKENQEIVDQVISNPGAIGFIGFAYFTESVTNLEVELAYSDSDTQEYVAPSFKNMISGKYPLRRSLRIYFRDDNDPAVRAFLSYLKSTQAQAVIESCGLIVDTMLASR